MSMGTLQPKVASTSNTPITVTMAGGDTVGFVEDGVQISGGKHFITTVGEFQVTLKNRPAVLDAKTGTYGKSKRTMSITRPVVLPSGRIVFNTVRIEQETHPSLDAAMVQDLRDIAWQALVKDSGLESFFTIGSLN